MKKNKIIFVYVIVALIYILMDWLRFDLILAVDSLGFNLIFGLVLLGFRILFIILFICSLVYLIIKYRIIKIKAFIPFFLMLVIIFYFIFRTYSPLYLDIDFIIHKAGREEIIEMYKENRLTQININTYIVPYRMVSHNKKVYIQNKDGIINAVFYISKGFINDRILIYVSDDSKANTNDFWDSPDYRKLINIRKASDNWYFADIQLNTG